MIRNIKYDYTKATEFFNGYQSPKELSYELMSASLNLSITDSGTYEDNVLALQRVVTDVRHLLESITEKGGSDE